VILELKLIDLMFSTAGYCIQLPLLWNFVIYSGQELR